MKMKRASRLIFPALVILSVVLYYSLQPLFTRVEQASQARRDKGWTQDLGDYKTANWDGRPGEQRGDVAVAPDGTGW